MVPRPVRWYHPTIRKEDEESIAAGLAKVMSMMCVQNTKLEDIHAGLVLFIKTKDVSHVVILDSAGCRRREMGRAGIERGVCAKD